MLRIYSVLLDLIADLGPLLRQLERRDADLARQCPRALSLPRARRPLTSAATGSSAHRPPGPGSGRPAIKTKRVSGGRQFSVSQ
jgi:hypothetical protein